MDIKRLQHVSVPRPPGAESHETAVRFYEAVLGCEEIPKPRTFTDIDVSWFRLGDDEIHVYAPAPGDGAPDHNAHFCLVVDDVRQAREHLEAAGFPCEDTTPIPNRPRFYTRDPFGNQIEISAIQGDYTLP
ncbi:MAG: VOC family protein [Chloroflexota bacterium]